MSTPSSTKQWLLNAHPEGLPTLDGANPTFKQTTTDLPALKDGQVLVKTRYLSNDPAQRGWIDHYEDERRIYVPPVHKGELMKAGALAEVVESKSDNVKKGDIVQATVGWTQYSVQEGKSLKALPDLPNGLPITHYIGALGMTGLTAHYGLVEIGRATKDDVVVVSGAAGAAGNMVVQIAKNIIGCKKVIGLAGGKDKCDYVKRLGADECIDYKTPGWKDELTKLTPDFVNVYFDNVGGDMLDFMLTRMALHSRVVACGAISAYNDTKDKKVGLKNWFPVIAMRIEIRGFIVFDHFSKFGETQAVLRKALEEGKLQIEEGQTVVKASFDEIPTTWLRLFEGKNTGKLVTELQ